MAEIINPLTQPLEYGTPIEAPKKAPLEYGSQAAMDKGMPRTAAKEISAQSAYVTDRVDEDLETTYKNSTDELERTGTSGLAQEAEAQLSREQAEAQIKALEAGIIDPETPPEIRDQMIDIYRMVYARQEMPDADFGEGVQTRAVAKTDTEMYREAHNRGLLAEAQMFGDLGDRIADADGEIDLADYGGLLLSFNESKTMFQAAATVFPDLADKFQIEGSMGIEGGMDIIAKELQALPREERAVKMNEFLNAVADNAGFIGGNEMLEKMAAVALLERMSGDDAIDEVNFWESVDHAVSFLEVVGLAGVVKTGVKAVGALRRGSMISRVATANPDEAADIAASGIRNREIAEAVGTTPEDIAVRNLLTKLSDEQAEFIEEGVRNNIRVQELQTQRVLDEAGEWIEETKFSVTGDSAKVMAEMEQRLNKAQNTRISIENSTMTKVADDVLQNNITLTFARKVTSQAEALEEAYKYLGRAHQKGPNKVNVRAVEVDAGTRKTTRLSGLETPKSQATRRTLKELKAEVAGMAMRPNMAARIGSDTAPLSEIPENALKTKLKTWNKRAKDHPDYPRIAADIKHLEQDKYWRVSPETRARFEAHRQQRNVAAPEYHYVVDVEIKTTVPREDIILFGENHISNSWGGVLDWLLDPVSKFGREITGIVERAVDKEARFKSAITNLAKPFAKMGNDSKLKVSKILAKGDAERKVYLPDELLAQGLNSKEVEGYLAFRRVEDLLFAVDNQRMTREARQHGHKWFTHEGTNYMAKPMSVDAAVAWATKSGMDLFDPVANGARRATADDVRKLYQRGGMIAELDVAEDVGTVRMSGMWAEPAVKVDELPASGIKQYLPGHIHRYYEDNYFVVAKTKGKVNGESGKDFFRVVGAASSKTEAEDMLKTIDVEDGWTLEWRHDRAMGRAEQEVSRKQAMRGTGELKHSRRGQHLRTSTDLAAIDNPVESLRKSVDATARTVGLDPVVAKLEKDFLRNFADLMPEGMYPNRVGQIGSLAGNKTDARIGKAKMMYNYIENLKGTPSAANDQWKLFWTRVGEYMEGTNMTAANMIKGIGEMNPVRGMRSLAFTMFIVGNPIRQLLLQSQQALFLAGINPKYIFNPNGLFRQNTGLMMAHLAARNEVDDVTGAWRLAATSLGVSVQEAKAMQKALAETGLLDSVSSHSFLRDSLQHFGNEMKASAAGKAVESARYMKDLGVGTLRKGFEWGELNNIQMSWLVARDRWLKDNPGKDWKSAKAEIHEMARGYSLSMTKAGEMRYQKGFFSMFTQFLSVQHKAILAMTTSKLFTPAQKARIIAGQVALFGAGGIGIRELYEGYRDEMNVEPNEDVDSLIEGGMLEYLLDNIVLATTGEEVDLNLSSSFAAGGGMRTSVANMFDMVLNAGDKSILEVALGPSGSAFNRVMDVSKTIDVLLRRDDLSPTEQLEYTLQEASRLFSGLNNYWKMKMGIKLMHHVDNVGNPIMQAQASELLAKGLFGIGVEKLDDLYKFYELQGGRPPTQGDLENIVDLVIENMQTTVLDAIEPQLADPSNPNMSIAQQRNGLQSALIDKHNTMSRALATLLEGEELMQARILLRQRLAKAPADSKEGKMLQRLQQNAIKGTTGAPLTDVITMLENSKLPNKDKYIELFRQLTERNERLSELQEERTNNG